MSEMNYIVRELQNRVANMIRRGKIHSTDFSQNPPRVRVEYGKDKSGKPVTTGWLPWISGRASNKHRQDWEPLAIGEQVLILSESGELSSGVVVPAMADSSSPVPSTSPDEHVSKYSDGTEIKYNRASHKLTITIGSGGDAELNCKTFFINADIEHDGKQHTTGNIKSDADITDKTRSMADDRGIYNNHDHAETQVTTKKPNQKQ